MSIAKNDNLKQNQKVKANYTAITHKFLFQIFLLVLVSLVVAIGAIMFGLQRQRQLTENAVNDELVFLTRAISSQNQNLIDSTKGLLATLSNSPETRTANYAACSTYLKQQIKEHPQYSSLNVSKPTGEVVCSSSDLQGPVNLSDRDFFKQVLDTKSFSVGKFQTGRITNLPVLPMGYPVLDEKGQVLAVFTAGIDLNWLNKAVSDLDLPDGSELMAVDGAGTILANSSSPNTQGKSALVVSVVKDNLGKKSEASGISTGLDGVRRNYSIKEFGGGGKAYIVLGLPDNYVVARYSEVSFRAVLILGGIALLAMLGIWLIAKRTLLKPLSMSSEQLKELKKENENIYYNIIENAPDPILTVNTKGVITGANKEGLALSGLKKEEIIGHSFMKLTKLITPESLALATKHFSDMLRGKKVDRGYEISLHTKNNQLRRYDVSSAEIRQAGELAGFQVFLRDVTERTKEHEDLQKRTVELEKMNRIMNDREIEMIRLKQEITKLKKKSK